MVAKQQPPGQIPWPPPGNSRGRLWAGSMTASGQKPMSLDKLGSGTAQDEHRYNQTGYGAEERTCCGPCSSEIRNKQIHA